MVSIVAQVYRSSIPLTSLSGVRSAASKGPATASLVSAVGLFGLIPASVDVEVVAMVSLPEWEASLCRTMSPATKGKAGGVGAGCDSGPHAAGFRGGYKSKERSVTRTETMRDTLHPNPPGILLTVGRDREP